VSMVGTLSSPTDARYSPHDTPAPSAPSAPETSPPIGSFTDAQHRDQKLPGGKTITTLLPRSEWIAFIPGAHPGYITTRQYEANLARLTANAAAHGPDRTAGPPREGPALLQGIIICGRCGGRMTIRYHTRAGQQTPTYLCQRDGISHGHPPCAVIPGHTLDQQTGEFLISQLTPLAAEAALTVSAELQHRAAEADTLRAAHVERARHHADLAKRRYLAVDPANRLVAETLEADWNTALRALGDAQATYDKARSQHPGQLTDQQKTRIRRLVTDLPGIWNDPATPIRERKRITRLLLTDVTVTRTGDTITAHLRLRGGQTCTLTLPAPKPGWAIRQTPPAVLTAIDDLLNTRTSTEIAAILNQRGLTNGQDRPYTPTMVDRVIRGYQLRPRRDRLRDTGLLTLSEMAAELGVSKTTVKDWYHAGIVTGQRYNHKGEVLYHPPGPNPPALHQGRRHHIATCTNAT
jgi:Recombinase zinc beta ribbon domain